MSSKWLSVVEKWLQFLKLKQEMIETLAQKRCCNARIVTEVTNTIAVGLGSVCLRPLQPSIRQPYLPFKDHFFHK